jgi:hypothetical protein
MGGIWAIIFFTLTLVMVVHTSTAMIFKHDGAANVTHPLLDSTDMPAFILHSLAYYIACVATTVFLLICAAITMGLAMLLMEIIAEGLTLLSSIRTVRPLQRGDTEQNDPDCDPWNYR